MDDQLTAKENLGKISQIDPSKPICKQILGFVCEDDVIYVGFRGVKPREPGQLLPSSPAYEWHAGWKALVQSENPHRMYKFCFRYFGQDTGMSELKRSWPQIRNELLPEMKTFPPNSKCWFLKSGEETTKFLNRVNLECSKSKFHMAKGTVQPGASIEHFSEKMGKLTTSFPSLEMICIDYEFTGSDEEAADYVPYITPEQLLNNKPSKGKAGPHDRILWAVMGIMANLPHLKHLSINFGGGQWGHFEERVWHDYVDEVLEEGFREKMREELKQWMAKNSHASEEENNEEAEEDEGQNVEEEQSQNS